jgi:hypothetical protein
MTPLSKIQDFYNKNKNKVKAKKEIEVAYDVFQFLLLELESQDLKLDANTTAIVLAGNYQNLVVTIGKDLESNKIRFKK